MTIAIFYADYFAGTLPGIILHIIIIPPIVWALRRAKLLSVDVEPSADAT